MGMTAFQEEQLVVYNESCICRIAGKVQRCFDGEHKMEYYKLCPVRAEHSSYYVPVAQAEKRMRGLMTEAEVLEMIDSLRKQELSLSEDGRERKETVNHILRCGDYREILCMLHALHKIQERCSLERKRMLVGDENAIQSAQERIFPEFALVLGISEDEVDSLIRCRLGE